MKIGIFFGTNTGNTENISYLIQKKIGNNSYVYDISNTNIKIIEKFDILLLGTST
ncbi:flavodoxin domain-containing protein [Candidatus Nardonella dryophthoridicola]|uniref:Flavodoxin domain-containing protein n=1 Tax=endosymbiont of Metamasius hemipterus TaxID=204627 RepID=A0ABT0TWG6_9GAMM|nr:flavodoxin domain-containing protein [Candidatus Nardonella dryophthoridicola]MCM0158274.1 flavodoxin domain-containing protein [endosymbiont of Metamasius hemipterus]MCM0158352.1 flavodoxin domain-containing protein [endosymbiont of Metamasius hemipterus]